MGGRGNLHSLKREKKKERKERKVRKRSLSEWPTGALVFFNFCFSLSPILIRRKKGKGGGEKKLSQGGGGERGGREDGMEGKITDWMR